MVKSIDFGGVAMPSRTVHTDNRGRFQERAGDAAGDRGCKKRRDALFIAAICCRASPITSSLPATSALHPTTPEAAYARRSHPP